MNNTTETTHTSDVLSVHHILAGGLILLNKISPLNREGKAIIAGDLNTFLCVKLLLDCVTFTEPVVMQIDKKIRVVCKHEQQKVWCMVTFCVRMWSRNPSRFSQLYLDRVGRNLQEDTVGDKNHI